MKQVSIKENLVLLSFRLFMHCKCRSKSLVMTARFPVIPNSCKKSLQKTSLKEGAANTVVTNTQKSLIFYHKTKHYEVVNQSGR